MLEIIRKELKLLKDINYYGSKDQIENEKLIIRFSFKDLGIEMEYNESIEEFYKRILEIYVTK
jgi:hypothetical protein